MNEAAATRIVNVRRKPMSVGAVALELAKQRPNYGQPAFDKVRTYSLPKPAPGVVPAAIMANDDASYAGLSAYGQDNTFGEGLGYFGLPYLAELAQRPEYRKGAEILAKTMTRKWIALKSSGEDKKDAKIKRLDGALKRYNVRQAFRRIAEHDGFFGRAHLFADVGTADDEPEQATRLTLDTAKIKQGSLVGFRVVEPLWTYPQAYNTTNPLDPTFYKPQAWMVMGRRIDASRLLTFVGREVPDILKPTYSFGGLSMSQIAKPYVDNWLRTRQSVSDLLHSYSTMVLKTTMDPNLNAGAANALFGRVDLFNLTRDNRGLMVLDKETEEFLNVAAPLGTLDALQAQSQEQMASVWSIPLVVLLGITPSGLNASSDGEIRTFYDWCHAYQEDFYRPHLTTVINMVQLSEFGEIDPDIVFDFEPLWQLDEAGLAGVQKTKADTHAVYMTAGVVDPDEVRQAVASDEDSPYHSLDMTGDAPGPPADPSLEEDPSSNEENVTKAGEKGRETGEESGV